MPVTDTKLLVLSGVCRFSRTSSCFSFPPPHSSPLRLDGVLVLSGTGGGEGFALLGDYWSRATREPAVTRASVYGWVRSLGSADGEQQEKRRHGSDCLECRS